jgi:hypothetical protein
MRTPTRRVIALLSAPALAALGITVGVSSSAHAATSCTGSFAYSQTSSSGGSFARLYGWDWTTGSSVCVGQADLQENFTTATGLDERVRVRANGTSGALLYEGLSGGTINGGTITFTQHVNQVFNYAHVGVCAAVVYQSNGQVDNNVPIVCETL